MKKIEFWQTATCKGIKEYIKFERQINEFNEHYSGVFCKNDCLLVVKVITPRKWKQKTKFCTDQNMYEIMLFSKLDKHVITFNRPFLEKYYSHLMVDQINLNRIKKVLNILHVIEPQKIEVNFK